MAHIPTDICPITGLPVTDKYLHGIDGRTYILKFDNNNEQLIYLPPSFQKLENEPLYIQYKHIIAGAILNSVLPRVGALGLTMISLENFENLLADISYPSTPQEKLDNLLSVLVSMQNFDGANINLQTFNADNIFTYRHYFRTQKELNFYMNTLYEFGYIKFPGEQRPLNPEVPFTMVILTFKGLQYFLQMQSSGKQSKKCFVAMAFHADLKPIREAIRSALLETGFNPILIDEVHYDSDQTINDAIISHLKEARFCIADFTNQRNGVYFESGFALGQNKQVIYCCHNNSFKDSHFDTDHFPHIKYDTPVELKIKLIDKIKAWIL